MKRRKRQKKIQAEKAYGRNKKQINATLDIEVYSIIDEYCKANGISKASLITNAVKYCIENNINLKNNV